MSRQKGKRDRPAPERRRFRERYERKSRRRERTPLTERPQWEAEITPGRRWAAIGAGTVVAMTAFGLIAAAVVEAGEGDDGTAMWLSIGAAATVPVMHLVLGFVSRAPRPWASAAIASPIVVVLFLAGSFLAREPATGFVLAVGVGGALTLRATEGVHIRSWRLWTAVGMALYTKLAFLLSPAIAVVSAPLLPLAGIGVVDRFMERKAAAR